MPSITVKGCPKCGCATEWTEILAIPEKHVSHTLHCNNCEAVTSRDAANVPGHSSS